MQDRHGKGGGENSGKTTIIISHRVSTLNYADTVAVLEDGRISEWGSPQALLAGGRFFARMAELQRLGETAAARQFLRPDGNKGTDHG